MQKVKRNITFSLPSELIRDAKVYAAQHDTSLNALVEESLEDTVRNRKRGLEAAVTFLELARTSKFKLNKGLKREDLHER